jgi:hypothetical protein
VAHTLTAAKPVQRFTGELSHKDTGVDDDGRLIATFAASRVLVIATTPPAEADEAEGQGSQGAQDAVETQESTAD